MRTAVVTVSCPNCGGSVDEADLGEKTKCEFCGTRLHLPKVALEDGAPKAPPFRPPPSTDSEDEREEEEEEEEEEEDGPDSDYAEGTSEIDGPGDEAPRLPVKLLFLLCGGIVVGLILLARMIL